MKVFGKNILFDASAHVAIAMLILYTLWFFIDQVKSARLPYLMVSMIVITIISLQRIIDNAHNDLGLLLGFVIGLLAIMISEWDHAKKYLKW